MNLVMYNSVWHSYRENPNSSLPTSNPNYLSQSRKMEMKPKHNKGKPSQSNCIGIVDNPQVNKNEKKGSFA